MTPKVKLLNHLKKLNYSLLVYYQHSDQKQYIGEPNNKKCRFCGRNDTETKFRKAHALPESIGNKNILSNEECYECNQKFSKLDNELGSFLNGIRTLCQIRGKTGIPSYRDNEIRIDYRTNEIQINQLTKKNLIKIDEDKKELTIPLKRNYIPIAVYKCFCKIAISLIPLEELKHFKELINWILADISDPEKYQIKNLRLYLKFKAGNYFDPGVDFALIKRISQRKKGRPYMLLFVNFSNLSFQIYLPFCLLDKWKGLKNKKYYKSKLFGGNYFDMSGVERVKDIIYLKLKIFKA